MGCAGEPVALADAETAARAARAGRRRNSSARRLPPPVYVIGTEVPVPGGAVGGLDHLQITRPDAVAATYDIHKAAFAAWTDPTRSIVSSALWFSPASSSGMTMSSITPQKRRRNCQGHSSTYPASCRGSFNRLSV